MRNETEFKSEIYSRLEKVKGKRKARKKIIMTVVPLLSAALIWRVIGIFNDRFIANDEDGSDGAAIGEVFEAEGSNNNNYKDSVNTITAGGNTAADDYSDEFILSDRIYIEKEKIEGFKALLGEFSDVTVTEGTAFKATGATVTLIIGDTAEKYILNKDAIYTEDMQKHLLIDEKKYEEIRKFINLNKSDK